jgi:hypothetical protein
LRIGNLKIEKTVKHAKPLHPLQHLWYKIPKTLGISFMKIQVVSKPFVLLFLGANFYYRSTLNLHHKLHNAGYFFYLSLLDDMDQRKANPTAR